MVNGLNSGINIPNLSTSSMYSSFISLSTNKFLTGIALLMLNIGSRYVSIELSQSTTNLLKLKLVRRFTMFCIFFVGTKDIIVSILLTSAFIIFSNGLFNEQSKFCILPKGITDNKKGEITSDEFDKATDTINQFHIQQSSNELNITNDTNKKIKYYEMKSALAKIDE
jgi:hypothetical protein